MRSDIEAAILGMYDSIERAREALLAQGGRYASMWKDYQTSAQWKVGKEGK